MRILAYIGAVILAIPAMAQQAQDSTQLDPIQAREAAELRVEADMVEMKNLTEALSRNLGQLHYLRTLCFGDEDQKWRNYASNLMNMESSGDSVLRRNLVRAFNAGYYHEKDRYKNCTESVAVDVAAISENGRHIAGMLADPYRER